MNSRVGKLVVIEGIDGTGKTTQINLLSKYLKGKGIDFAVISFPQYGKNKFADYIKDYLSGKFGSINDVGPKKLAKVYADDRKTVRDQINEWLNRGKLVIANRYVSSSKAHLGAHLDEDRREDFTSWVNDLEYEENGMPITDLTILLNVDPRVGQKNSQEKNHPDLHEDNLKHLEKANKIFLKLSKHERNWVVVNCMENGKMKSPENIHEEIVKILESVLLSLS